MTDQGGIIHHHDSDCGCGSRSGDRTVRVERDVWIPEYSTSLVEVHGHEWPLVLVKRFESNEIGERRFVESRFYVPEEKKP